ncbi:MAG: hypothetical protein JWM57_2264 [Phycisphaerales bacterium]|nr:hypothetical protein [Phycisphaerales bacterium]
MQTLPANTATHVPEDIDAKQLIWAETFSSGEYGSRVLKRGTRVRLVDVDGDACCQFIVHHASRPYERLNVADTVKVQWNGYLGEGKLLLSDMGRVLMSIVRDTSGRHDTFCGPSTAWSNAKRYGDGENYSKQPNARDRFLLALLKHGMGKKDIPPSLNFFKGVTIGEDGSLHFNGDAKPSFIELRAEMDVLVTFANCPHVLDPRPGYTASPLRAFAWQGPPTLADDPIRNASPEAQRAFENVDDWLL